jgi:hypothetical protein
MHIFAAKKPREDSDRGERGIAWGVISNHPSTVLSTSPHPNPLPKGARELVCGNVKGVVIIGETRDMIVRFFKAVIPSPLGGEG